MPRKVFTAGEILTAANLNDVSDATVMVFDDAAARTTAIPTPVEGMVTYLKDTNQVQAFTGAAFAPIGTILQVVSTTKTDTFTSGAAGYVDVTGLSASITPSATSSKVLVLGHISGSIVATDSFRLTRGGTPLSIADAAGARRQATGGFGGDNSAGVTSAGMTFLDSPSSTSSLTYQIQVDRGVTGTVFINRSGADEDSANRIRTTSSITLLEVAG